jgi:hypothetical protein
MLEECLTAKGITWKINTGNKRLMREAGRGGDRVIERVGPCLMNTASLLLKVI